MIPEGWSKERIGNILERVSLPVNPKKGELYREIGIRSHGKGIFHKEPTTSDDIGNKRVFEVVPDNFIVNIVFAWEQAIAKTTSAEKGFIASHRFPQFKPKNNSCDIDWLVYFFKTKFGKHLLTLASPGGAGRNKTLGQKEFEKTKLLLPPLEEQKVIAAILSKWDEAIEKIDALIAAKEKRKKALMQQLLTGKKRFKEFEGEEWKEVRLEEIVKDTQLGTTERGHEEPFNEAIPLLKMGNLAWGNISFEKLEIISKSKVEKKLILRKGDFLFNTRNTPQLVGKSAVWNSQFTEATFDNNINRITFKSTADPKYICYYLTHGKGKSTIQSLPAGSTSVAAIYWKDLKKVKLPLPSLYEQKSIIKVLESSDCELNNLASKATMLRSEKKALMQQLLTGKVRTKTA